MGDSSVLPIGMGLRKQELELDAALTSGQPLVLQTLHVIRHKSSPNVDFERRLLNSLLSVVEEFTKHIEYGRLVRYHLLEVISRVF